MTMFKTLAAVATACVLTGGTPLASAEPGPSPLPLPAGMENPPRPAEGDPGPPLDNGVVASEPPATVTTPDGWVLALAAEEETQLPIPPLTTATSSREYLAGGTFIATVKGGGSTKLKGGTVEAGYQIGCGIALSGVRLTGSIGLSSSIGQSGLGNSTFGQAGVVGRSPSSQ